MQTKSTHHIRNWAEYNRALIQRGSLTVWIEEKVTRNWFSTQPVIRGLLIIFNNFHAKSLKN